MFTGEQSLSQTKSALSVTVRSPKVFKDLDKSLFKRFYLGYPYCFEREDNFLLKSDNLINAIKEIKDLKKEVFIVTPGVMQNADFDLIEGILSQLVLCGLDGIEVNDVGMFSVAKKWPTLKITSGHFTNIYHHEAALEYANEGATTLIPNSELMAEELAQIAIKVNCEIEVAVYGNLALGFVHDCYLKEIDSDNECKQQCVKSHNFVNHEMSMRNIGRANVTKADYCLVEHIEKIFSVGADLWRLEMYQDNALKINEVARLFVDGLAGDLEMKSIDRFVEKNDLCNGWFFGKPGHAYVDSELRTWKLDLEQKESKSKKIQSGKINV